MIAILDGSIAFITEFHLANPEGVHQASRCLLDGLGALVARSSMPVAKIVASFALNHLPATPKKVALYFPVALHPCSAQPSRMVLHQMQEILSMDREPLKDAQGRDFCP